MLEAFPSLEGKCDQDRGWEWGQTASLRDGVLGDRFIIPQLSWVNVTLYPQCNSGTREHQAN